MNCPYGCILRDDEGIVPYSKNKREGRETLPDEFGITRQFGRLTLCRLGGFTGILHWNLQKDTCEIESFWVTFFQKGNCDLRVLLPTFLRKKSRRVLWLTFLRKKGKLKKKVFSVAAGGLTELFAKSFGEVKLVVKAEAFADRADRFVCGGE